MTHGIAANGGGSFVNEVSEKRARALLANYFYFKDLTIEDLSELRKLIEPHAAARAAETMSTEDLRVLNELNKQARENLDKKFLQEMSINEINFHRAIAQTTSNPILVLILDFVEDLLEDFKKSGASKLFNE